MFNPNAETPNFPDPEQNYFFDDNPIAIGGKLTPKWLIKAYSSGIFPWFNDDNLILWWSPNPRAIMTPKDVVIQKSMRSYFNQNKFTLKIDTAFENVINLCSKTPRKYQKGTWITNSMIEAYIQMHKLGYAHSFEAWFDDKLVGGLYGISLGNAFFGESMFSLVSNASKFAFISLCRILDKNNFALIDCQVSTSHLNSMGCGLVTRQYFLEVLAKTQQNNTLKGSWTKLLEL